MLALLAWLAVYQYERVAQGNSHPAVATELRLRFLSGALFICTFLDDTMPNSLASADLYGELAGSRICASLAVVTKELPMEFQERWRAEFVLPVTPGVQDVPVFGANELTSETYLTKVTGYAGSRHPAELAGIALSSTIFGTPEPPQDEPRDYEWNRAFFLVVVRPQEPSPTKLAHVVADVQAERLRIHRWLRHGRKGFYYREFTERDRDPFEPVLREMSAAVQAAFDP